jgi:LAO/AO transport system kinase
LSDPLGELRAGGKAALARALAQVEATPADETTLALLDAAWSAPRAVVIGLTGPPGVGKSTLVSAFLRAWRGQGRTVGVIAVDPSSRRTRGALLGDRTRIDVDPDDAGVFVRSMAARDRLGGLADLAAAATVLMRALYDVVLVETVGVGQSETEIAELADTVVFAVQPGSGDSLQFMKAGIVEIPDVALVTKADLGGIAERARRDLEGALGLVPGAGEWEPPVLLVSATTGQGIDAALDAIDRHAARQRPGLALRRADQGRQWLERWLREECGRRGAVRAAAWLPTILADRSVSPFRWLSRAVAMLDPR